MKQKAAQRPRWAESALLMAHRVGKTTQWKACIGYKTTRTEFNIVDVLYESSQERMAACVERMYPGIEIRVKQD